MSLPVVWIPEANADLKKARSWYEAIHPDLGKRFALAVDWAVEVIAQSPLRIRKAHREIRRVGMRRFPYGLYGRKPAHCGDCLYARPPESEALEAPA